MSTDTDSADRDPFDRYYTPPALASVSLGWLGEVAPAGWAPSLLVEPCAGGGAYLEAGAARWPGAELMASDIDPEAPTVVDRRATRRSVLDPALVSSVIAMIGYGHKAGLIVTNPPYAILSATIAALRILQRAMSGEGCRAPLLLLLRETALSHLCAGDDPPDVIGLTPIRPTYEGPAGARLLDRARARGEERRAARRRAEIDELRAELEGTVNPTLREAITGRIRHLEAHPLRPSGISTAGSDTCGSALALWRSPGAPGPRLWHPIAPWRERGRR
jgi:hypothetical protein